MSSTHFYAYQRAHQVAREAGKKKKQDFCGKVIGLGRFPDKNAPLSRVEKISG